MYKIKISITLVIAGAIFIFQSFMSQQESAPIDDDEWKLLAITTVKGNLDKDEIKVGALKGSFTAIKIKVKAAPLEMKKFVVHYGNGEKHQILVRKNFPKDSESRAIDLKGEKRVIKKIVFWYGQKKWGNKKPVVAILGKK